MKTLHIIGFKNSGKTTVVARWVRLLKEEGFTVAVLKHHGHSEALEMPAASTDTMQFFSSGADVTAVAGAGTMQLMMNYEPTLQQMKDLILPGNPDILLIEGYKMEQGEKVVLLRDEDEWNQLKTIKGVRLVVGLHTTSDAFQTIGSRTDEQQLDNWFMQWVREDSSVETI